MFLIKWLSSSATSTSTSTTAKTESNERHEQCGNNDNDGDQDNQPIFLQNIVVLMFFDIRSKFNIHFAYDEVTWNGNSKLINTSELQSSNKFDRLSHAVSIGRSKKFEFPTPISLFHFMNKLSGSTNYRSTSHKLPEKRVKWEIFEFRFITFAYNLHDIAKQNQRQQFHGAFDKKSTFHKLTELDVICGSVK